MTFRHLTLGEISIANTVFGAVQDRFGNPIDWSSIVVAVHPQPYQQSGQVVGLAEGVFYHSTDYTTDKYRDDFSALSPDILNFGGDWDRSVTFVHELAHVVQMRQGLPYYAYTKINGRDYNFEHGTNNIFNGTALDQLNPESSAEFYAEFFVKKYGLLIGATEADIDQFIYEMNNRNGLLRDDGQPIGQHTLAEYEARATGQFYNGVSTGTQALQWSSFVSRSTTDPIVLDLNGDGVNLVGISESNAYFDLHNTGFSVKTGWIDSHDGLLVVDRNNNGAVDNITELFGNEQTDGFTALRSIDVNHDNVIDNSDAAWNSLKVWVDTNGDGITNAGELKTLSELNITEIDLNTESVNVNINGNIIGDVASFKYGNGTHAQVAEAFFDNSQLESSFTGEWTLNSEVWALPDARGYGTVPDLFIAMSMDNSLLNMVKDLAATPLTQADTFDAQTLAILYKWAEVETIDPASRGQYVDAQHLAVLEKFSGQDFISMWGGVSNANPQNAHQGEQLESAFGILLDAIETRLLVQGPLASLVPSAGYDYTTDAIVGTVDFSSLFANLGAFTPSGEEAAANYWSGLISRCVALADTMGVDRSTFEVAYKQAFVDAGLPFSVAAVANNGLVIGGSSAANIVAADNGAHAYILGSASDTVRGGDGNDLIAGGAGNDILEGSGGTNIISGGAGNDTIVVRGTNDHVYGGDGSDIIDLNRVDVTNFGSTIVDGGNGFDSVKVGYDATYLGAAVTLSNIENIQLSFGSSLRVNAASLVGISNISGYGYYVQLETAGTGIYDLSGMSLTMPVNIVNFSDYDVHLVAGATTQSIASGNGNDILDGRSANGITLNAGGGSNTIYGSLGNDTIVTYSGADLIYAGDGDDRININVFSPSSVVDGGSGTDTIRLAGGISHMTLSNIEVLEFSSSLSMSAAQLYSFSSINVLDGGVADIMIDEAGVYDLTSLSIGGSIRFHAGSGNDVVIDAPNVLSIDGGSGNDTLISSVIGGHSIIGGAGTDTANFSSSDSAVYVNLGSNNVTAGSVTLLVGKVQDYEGNIDSLSGIENITGSSHDDILIAGSSSSVIDGGAGNDLMIGGTGNDTFIVSDLGDLTQDTGGTDIVLASVSHTLGAGVENLTLTGGKSATGTGNSLANIINGDASNNTLYGLDGNDTLDGNGGDDLLVGGNGNDIIYGRAGNDTIDASAGGADMIYGGSETDTISFKDAAAAVRVNLDTAPNSTYAIAANTAVNSGTQRVYQVENIIGSSFADTLIGTAGNNIIDGGVGYRMVNGNIVWNNDLLAGLGGDDTYIVNSRMAIISEQIGKGTDNVIASVDYTLSSNVENLTLVGAAGQMGKGNELDNILTGNSVGSTLIGRAGNDTFISGAGLTTVSYTDAQNSVYINLGNTDVSLPELTASILYANSGDDSFGGVDTYAGITSLVGSYYDDILIGTSGNDSIDGNIGADYMMGGAGNDTYYVDDLGDIVADADGYDTVVSAVYEYTLGESLDALTLADGYAINGTGNDQDNVINGNADSNVLLGMAGNDIITAGAGDDLLDGGEGADILDGGAGLDSYVIDNVGDVIIDIDGGQTITSYISFVLPDNFQELILLGSDDFDLSGNALDNVMYGNAGNNSLSGGGGNDTLSGGDGDDILYGGDGDDTVWGGTGSDQIIAGGGQGNDYYDGGDGVDTIKFESTSAGVTVNLAQNSAYGSEIDTDFIINVENVVGGSGNDTIIGDDLGNYLHGGAGGNDSLYGGDEDDILVGGTGNDVLSGGDGFDTASYTAATGSVLVNLSGTSQTLNGVVVAGNSAVDGLSGVDTLSSIESVICGNQNDNVFGSSNAESIFGGAGNDVLSGYAGDDYLDGGDGNDTIYGGLGSDTLIGGNGIDSLQYNSATSGISLNLSDTAKTLNGVAYAAGTGADGQGSIDTISGFEYVYASNYNDFIQGSDSAAEIMYGYNGNDFLSGGGGNDSLYGQNGDDTLVGSSGNDVLDGGAGIDTVDYSSATDHVLVNLSGSSQTLNGVSLSAGTAVDGLGGTDSISNVENIAGGGFDDYMIGNSSANTISGGAGDDHIYGGDGNDTLIGGAGADYLDGQGGDNIVSYADSPSAVFINISPYNNVNLNGNILAAYTGMDGWGSVDSYANIKGIVGSAYDDWLLGSDLSDSIRGGAGNDHIIGSWGNDTMIGDAGNDYIDGNGGNNTVAYSSSVMGVTVNLSTQSASDGFGYTDTLIGINNVTGSDYADTIIGDGTANIIRAGKGNDLVAGGAGADTFAFANGEGADRITDYEDGVDHFELKALGISFAGLSFTDTVDGCKISWSGGDIFTLSGVTASQMNSGDFIFTT